MNTGPDTTIRVSCSLREQVKAHAAQRGIKQADLIALALRELEQTEFLRAVAATEWDLESESEAKAWDGSDLAGGLEPWSPPR
ncbi:MAG: hypothetical protein LBO75_00390 [Bifidobacteriaceae bacterium]|nr:hypothetical protein [Bifidobacteriaceae bacterium]